MYFEFFEIPYYEPRKNLREQITKSSQRRKQGEIKFIVKKLINYFFESLAYNCPVNSWRVQLHRLRGVNIGRNVFIGLRCTLDHAYPEQIYIDDDVSLAGDVYIVAHSNPYPHFRRILLSYVAAVRIKQGCWIGARATILPGVQIGEYSVVSAGSVVQYNISPLSIVRGNPAQIIKRIKHIDK